MAPKVLSREGTGGKATGMTPVVFADIVWKTGAGAEIRVSTWGGIDTDTYIASYLRF